MPKVKVNNTQGLVQETGGGIALFGATETVTTTGTAAGGAAIASTTSLAIATLHANNGALDLPATGSLDAGHTVVVVNTHGSHGLQIFPVDQSGGEKMNGLAGGSVTIDAKCASKFIYSGANDPGWVVIMGSTDEVPA